MAGYQGQDPFFKLTQVILSIGRCEEGRVLAQNVADPACEKTTLHNHAFSAQTVPLFQVEVLDTLENVVDHPRLLEEVEVLLNSFQRPKLLAPEELPHNGLVEGGSILLHRLHLAEVG